MPISGPDPDWISRLTEEARILGEARMLRDDEELTPEKTALVIERFNAFLTRVNKSQEWAARSLGMKSASVLSQILTCTYAADPEKHIRAIDKWIEVQALKENAPRPAGFVKTIGIARKIAGAARWAIETGDIAMVVGPAGVGKTITAMAVRAETPGSIFISICTPGLSPLSVLESIARTMNLTSLKMTGNQLFTQIASALKGSGRLLIVDEIHKLVGRKKDGALHTLRDLYDATEIPMLWLGTSDIIAYIRAGMANHYEPLDQLHSRIGYCLNLAEEAASPGGGGFYSIEDIQKIITEGKLRITPDATRFLQMLANTPGTGALRAVTKLLKLAVKYAERSNKVIDAEMLREIQGSRLGTRVATQVESEMQIFAQRVA